MGSITYGQSKDLSIPFSPELVHNCEFTLTYDDGQKKDKSLQFHMKNSVQQADLKLIARHKFRLEFVNCVRTVFEQMKGNEKNKSTSTSQDNNSVEIAINQIKVLEAEMKNYADGNDEYVKDLLIDLTGQVQQAIEREDWFKKWGVHFLPSLTRKFILIETYNSLTENNYLYI